MKAVVINGTGQLDSLQTTSLKTPKPKVNEVLVKVNYCGINHLDLLIIESKRPGPINFPHILGSEIVGKVVNSFEDVVVYPWTFCGVCKQCKIGNENICDQGGTIGRTRWGGYAEFVAVPKSNIIKIPGGLPLDLVCAVILAGTTAVHLIKRAKIKDKGVVLLTGATGGVGTVVLQLLKRRGCKVICITSHKNKSNKLLELGADAVYESKNFVDRIKRDFPGGTDYVIDIVGGQVWSKSLELLAKNGTMVFCATTLDQKGEVDIGRTFSKQLNILGSYGGRIEDLKEVLQLVKRGGIKPVIDSMYSLDNVKSALKKLKD